MKEKYILINDEEELEKQQQKNEEKNIRENIIKNEIGEILDKTTNVVIDCKPSAFFCWVMIIFFTLYTAGSLAAAITILMIGSAWGKAMSLLGILMALAPTPFYSKTTAYMTTQNDKKFIIEETKNILKKRRRILLYRIGDKCFYTFLIRKKLFERHKLNKDQIDFFYHYELSGRNFCKQTKNDAVIYSYLFFGIIPSSDGVDIHKNWECVIKCQNNEIKSIKSYERFSFSKLTDSIEIPQEFIVELEKENVLFGDFRIAP